MIDHAYDTVLHSFSKKVQRQILTADETENCLVQTFSLICDADSLRKCLQKDIDAGIRSADVIQRSIARIGLYEKLDTEKIDVSHINTIWREIYDES